MKKSDINHGFTLIEVLVSAAILVLLGAGFVGLQYIYTQNQVIAWQGFENIQDANRLVSAMTREIRGARESENGSYPLVEALDNSIIFYTDSDFNGSAERVRYTLSGNQLVKGVIKPVGQPATYPAANEQVIVLTENVRNAGQPPFYYYNGSWPDDTVNNPLLQERRIADTRMIKIILRLNTKDDPGSDYILESNILVRTLKGS
jgi:prepilin-type N-terminal cleavage/methylation domain-containing protein